MGLKRVECQEKQSRAGNAKVPSNILVQPLGTRDFVSFVLSMDNTKDACKRFYDAPQNTCDVLASDPGPPCANFEQLKCKKVFFIRVLQPQSKKQRKENFETPEKDNMPKRAKSGT